MYLSKLEIFGFKSFAQKAVFKFDDGLTAIIGPNGCGKSNIVDAIRWVLGEQRPSVLRLDRMENVIFNGTATRKPLNLAEVSIYIENTKQILPSEYTEIKITRRLHRSGESEYLINNQQVRLMDIINLFADTGMGADAYSVIELKMVEQILSDNAEERRRLFEEAAGIKKYKQRRKSALRKLDATRQELVRLNDIIAEVQKTVNSLARQVGKARRYLALKDAIALKERWLAELRIRELQQEREPLATERQQVQETVEKLATEVRTLEAQLEEKEARAAELENAYRNVAGRLQEKDETIRQLQETVRLKEQKVASLEDNRTARQQEIAAAESQLEQLKAALDTIQEQEQAIRQQLQDFNERYKQKANELLLAEEAYQEAKTLYQEFVSQNRDALQEGDELKNRYQKLEIEWQSKSERLSQLQSQRERFQAQQQEVDEKVSELEAGLAEIEQEAELYQKEIAHLQQKLEEREQQLHQLREQIIALQGEIEKHKSRLEVLERVITNYEGFAESVRFVMGNKGQFRDVLDTLANMVDADAEYRPALESYLQEVANYIVVERTQTAREVLQAVRNQQKGRVTVLPLEALNGSAAASSVYSVNGKAVAMWEVVRPEEQARALFEFLLKDVYVVDSIEDALSLRQEFPEATFVTREGEVIGKLGQITGGSAVNGSGLIGRKKEYQRLQEALTQKQEALQATQQQLTQLQEAQQADKHQLKHIQEMLTATRREAVEKEKQLSRARYEQQRLQESLETLETEISNLQDVLDQLVAEKEQLQPQLAAADSRVQEYFSKEKELTQLQASREATYQALQKETQELQIQILNLQAQLNEQEQKLQFNRQQQEDLRQRIATNQQQIQAINEQIQQLTREIDDTRAQLNTLYQERDAIHAEKEQVEKAYQAARHDITVLEDAYKKKVRLLNQGKDRIAALDLKLKELEVKIQGQRDWLKENYGEDPLPEPVPPDASVLSLQEELDQLKNKLASLGDVNPLAVQEHEKAKERLSFLKQQQGDLLEAERQLLETIERLNTTARQQFVETFEKIRTNFQQVFGDFFENGSGDLVLVDSKDPLEANIDITVKIKGRRLNTLQLLSAGEKTLTAISLLFAIYLVKPSPFCILDEVDAPLDDVNISRFTAALKRFTRDTQFILVTHNKRTMEAANTMYGITMEEPGVSKVVSVRLD